MSDDQHLIIQRQHIPSILISFREECGTTPFGSPHSSSPNGSTTTTLFFANTRKLIHTLMGNTQKASLLTTREWARCAAICVSVDNVPTLASFSGCDGWFRWHHRQKRDMYTLPITKVVINTQNMSNMSIPSSSTPSKSLVVMQCSCPRP